MCMPMTQCSWKRGDSWVLAPDILTEQNRCGIQEYEFNKPLGYFQHRWSKGTALRNIRVAFYRVLSQTRSHPHAGVYPCSMLFIVQMRQPRLRMTFAQKTKPKYGESWGPNSDVLFQSSKSFSFSISWDIIYRCGYWSDVFPTGVWVFCCCFSISLIFIWTRPKGLPLLRFL